jgi:DNA-binding response OmpR family regulator
VKALRVGEIALDPQRMTGTLARQPVTFTGRELQLLKYFLERPGRLVTRGQLLTDV